MAVGIISFTVTPSGNDINYAISWDLFACAGTRQIRFDLFDYNRNAIIATNTVSVLETDSYSSSFTSVYRGYFTVIANFLCSGSSLVVVEQGPVDNTTTSTIAPPGGGGGSGGSEPPPVTNNPDDNPSVCFPTTGALSMGDINAVLGRDRDLADTLLSGPNNPSTSPSQFGLSFLPTTGNPSKTTPNAISEFRGYCHVAPVPNVDLFYQLNTNTFGTGSLVINYLDGSGTEQTLTITHSDAANAQQNSGNLTIKAGSALQVTVNNTSQIITLTTLTAQRNGGTVYNSGNTTSTSLTYILVLNTGDTTAQVYGVADGGDPFG